MKYKNLQDLIRDSNSSRKFFISLPVSLQAELHKHNEYIHSAEELHLRADLVRKNMQYIKNGNWVN